MRIASLTAAITEVPLRHAFATAQDTLARQVTRPVVITAALDDGRCFTGESVPVAYVTGETPETVLAAVERARPALLDADVLRLRPLTDALTEALPDAPTTRAGIEIALWRAFAEIEDVPLWRLFGGASDHIETDITLPMTEDYLTRAHDAHARGFRRLKVKVGSTDPDEDLRRLEALMHALPDVILRIDANQAFEHPDAAVRFLESALRTAPAIEVFEQPTPKHDLPALDAIAARFPDLVFADEAVLGPADALRLVRETRVRGINVKLMKAGVQGALDIVAIARAADRRLMIGCMLETRANIGFALQLACGTGAFAFADLDSHLLLNKHAAGGFRQEGPVLYAEAVTHGTAASQ